MRWSEALAITVAMAAPAVAQSAPHGLWIRGDGAAVVRFEPCGRQLCATNTVIRDQTNGESVGDRLVLSVKPDGAGRLSGKAYDVKRNRTYAIDMRFTDTTMTTRGCLLGVLCKTVSWRKAP
ncbi:MAG: DUF2147 domain-containing protein [Hyphomicrobiales bacterium]|nr:DUF2147 domain-containing protein [Hyphomicrobiales bacterium]